MKQGLEYSVKFKGEANGFLINHVMVQNSKSLDKRYVEVSEALESKKPIDLVFCGELRGSQVGLLSSSKDFNILDVDKSEDLTYLFFSKEYNVYISFNDIKNIDCRKIETLDIEKKDISIQEVLSHSLKILKQDLMYHKDKVFIEFNASIDILNFGVNRWLKGVFA